jgi:hypothetical protein
MAIVYSYPTAVPELQDLLIGTEMAAQGGEDAPRTKTFTVGSIVDLANGGVVGPEGPQGPTGAQGIQGFTGTAGAVGPAGLEWKGAWTPMMSYIEDDAVGWDGASWFCILASTGSTVPSLDPTHWALLASRGAQGIQGVQGPTGAQGPAGSGAGTLQQTVDNGNTIDSFEGPILSISGTEVKIQDSLGGRLWMEYTSGGKPTIQFGIPNSGGLRTDLQTPDVQTGNRTIKLPDASGTIALTSDIVTDTYRGQWDYTGDTTYAVGDIVTSFTYSNDFLYQMYGTYRCIEVPTSNYNPGIDGISWVQLGLTQLAKGTRLKGAGTANDPITLRGYKRVGYIYATSTNNPQIAINYFTGMEIPSGVTESFARVSTGSYELRYTAIDGNAFVNNLGADNFFQYSFSMNPNIVYGGAITTTSGGNRTLVIGFQNKPAGVLTDGFTTVNYSMEWFE